MSVHPGFFLLLKHIHLHSRLLPLTTLLFFCAVGEFRYADVNHATFWPNLNHFVIPGGTGDGGLAQPLLALVLGGRHDGVPLRVLDVTEGVRVVVFDVKLLRGYQSKTCLGLCFVKLCRSRLKAGLQVWRIVFPLLLTTSARLCLQHSLNLGTTF